jgi:hypothetical protein
LDGERIRIQKANWGCWVAGNVEIVIETGENKEE